MDASDWLEELSVDELCECAHCGELIEDPEDETSSPHGSMHTWCAAQHEDMHPEEW